MSTCEDDFEKFNLYAINSLSNVVRKSRKCNFLIIFWKVAVMQLIEWEVAEDDYQEQIIIPLELSALRADFF